MCQRLGRAWKFLRWLHGSRLLLWAFLLWLFLSFRRDITTTTIIATTTIRKGESHTVAAIMCVAVGEIFWRWSGDGDLGLRNWAGLWPRDWDLLGPSLLLSGCQNKVKNQMFLISTLTASWQRSINFDNVVLSARTLPARINWKACFLESWNLSQLMYTHMFQQQTRGVKNKTNFSPKTCWQV